MRVRVIAAMMPVMLVCMIAAFGAANTEADASAKRADIKHLLELTGAGKLGVQFMNQLQPSLKQAMPEVPEQFWNDFMAEVDPNELEELVVPIYEKYFTHDEVKELIKFYESPIGKKLNSVQPQIMQECVVAGQEWGRKLGEKVTKKLQEQEYK